MKSFLSNRKNIKLTALILVASIIFGSIFNLTVPVLSAGVINKTAYVKLDDEPVSEVMLDEDAKLRFEAVSENKATAYQWQIKDPLSDERWINISDGFSKYLWVTRALVGSMLDLAGTAQLRCRMQTAFGEVFTTPVKVILSLKVIDDASNSNAVITNVSLNKSYSTKSDHTTYSIVINYLFDNNAIAFEPYGASVARGSDFKATIKSPEVVGYAPFRRVGDDYIDATVVEFDLTNITQNITINVIYEPALVEYSVHHHLQNLYDDEYSTHYDLITKSKALTGSIVGDGLALTEEELPGFKALAYEKLTVAADGSTVIEIRYDRNYYLVDFDMNGGYGTEPVYTRYGMEVGANIPVRHGYVFDGWELVSYGGEAPTIEQQSKYSLSEGTTIKVPSANLRYKARWITQQTTYTMVFWRENADNSGYSYWGYLDNLTAMSGSFVSGQDYISRVEGIDDEQYFTFNENKTEKNILVEGDGSTVVNVYYTRNYYTITFKAKGLCSLAENHTHTDSCYEKVCGLSHIHTAECVPTLDCSVEEHKEHTDSCIICGKKEHIHGSVGCNCTLTEHTHTVNCWNNIGSVQSSLNGAPSNPEEGQIYRSGVRYYIYIGGRWYRYNGRGVSSGDIVDSVCGFVSHTHGTDCSCDEEAHSHTDSCYRDSLHTHIDACYKYSCGEQEHIHSESCLRLICSETENHTHTTSCKSSSSTNTVKKVYAKYGQSIKNIWPVKDDNGVVYNSGQRWEPSNSTFYSAVLVYIEQMPPDDFTLTLNTANYKTYTMNYYLQALSGDSYDVQYNSKQYKLDNTIVAIYNYITKAEDFFDINGFVQYASDPAFGSNNQITTNSNALTVNFYYDRITDHYLEFNNNGTVLDDKAVYGVPYGAPLKEYNFVPSYPENLEPNAYTFDGWYISPGCFAGTEVDWETLTSPVGDLMLYAKWVPITHRVRVFKDATLSQQIGDDQIVDHKAFASAPSGDISNGNYVFQGWFYMDEVNGEMVEKAFAFNGIPVLEDLDVYAKWSSHVSVDYKINYKLFNTDIDIADPTVGSAIAGHNKTFDAKAGDLLYNQYQTGYYPLTNSHTITMSVDGTHEFTFYYVYVESMPYKVQYVNATTGEKLCEDSVFMDNSLSVVTETFKRFEKMMPDAYQKRLVLSADNTDTDNDGIFDSNVITFYYDFDEEHAYYRVVHYIQNMLGDTYREYRSEEMVGVIGDDYSVNALTLTGFKYNGNKTVINGVVTPNSDTTVTTTLGGDGALIEFYYDRETYNYTVKYLDSKTGVELSPDKTGSGVFGEQIIEYAKNLDSLGYELVSDNVKTSTISANEEINIIEFYYQEKTVSIKYQVVGPAGCGVLSQYSENLTAISSVPNGSTPIVSKGFIFKGWYTNPSCTEQVESDWIDEDTYQIIPQKSGDIWNSVIYYAKFEALETDLTITTTATNDIDTDQAFIFSIKGKAGTDTEKIDLTVTVIGNNSVTVTALPTGDYTVTELTDWSWRYENISAEREVTLEYKEDGTEIIYNNSRQNGKWLDGNAVKNNEF
ncbi:MAG: hypothetical protein E7551_07275 [Ruminococcaceae bacterium]|nr:hypothetical protein [Oscillospiraceae bacterium]